MGEGADDQPGPLAQTNRSRLIGRMVAKGRILLGGSALIAGLAYADSVAIPPTQANESVAIGCSVCNISNNSTSPGGVIASGHGAYAQASANLGTNPVVQADATTTESNTGADAIAEVRYGFAIVPNGQPGTPPAPYGVPFSILSTFEYSSSAQGDLTFAGGGVASDGGDLLVPISLNGTGGGCSQDTTCNDMQGDYLPPNTPQELVVQATCDVYGIGTCHDITDPTITIAPAYAAYYTVVYNPDLTSGSPGGGSSATPEPATLAIMCLGLPLIAAARNRKKLLRSHRQNTKRS